MKKKLILKITIIIIVVSFAACGNIKKEDSSMINYESGIFYDKNWSETVGTYTGAVIPDKETALEIAKVIFNGMDKSKEVEEYVPKSVFFDCQDEIWIISFWKDSDEIILGGDCSIAIQKADGKVLRIWFGE